MKNIDETILINRSLNSDSQAFAQLVDLHKAMVFNIVIKILRKREEAEECAQDVFIKVYQSLNTFKHKAKFSTWLYRIAFNMAISRNRKKSIETTELNEDIYRNITEDEIYSNFEKQNIEEQCKIIDKAIEALPAEDAVIITLFYLDEKSVEELAFIMGLTKSNIKVKLHRARKKLYVMLSKTFVIID